MATRMEEDYNGILFAGNPRTRIIVVQQCAQSSHLLIDLPLTKTGHPIDSNGLHTLGNILIQRQH